MKKMTKNPHPDDLLCAGVRHTGHRRHTGRPAQPGETGSCPREKINKEREAEFLTSVQTKALLAKAQKMKKNVHEANPRARSLKENETALSEKEAELKLQKAHWAKCSA